MSSRDPAVSAAYAEYQRHQSDECPFCVLGDREIIESSAHFVILRALFPYKEWDGRVVREHLMLVPKRHVTAFDQFTSDEAMEVLAVISRYEASGFSIYARAPRDTTRSITHQHTHLLLLTT